MICSTFDVLSDRKNVFNWTVGIWHYLEIVGGVLNAFAAFKGFLPGPFISAEYRSILAYFIPISFYTPPSLPPDQNKT